MNGRIEPDFMPWFASRSAIAAVRALSDTASTARATFASAVSEEALDVGQGASSTTVARRSLPQKGGAGVQGPYVTRHR